MTTGGAGSISFDLGTCAGSFYDVDGFIGFAVDHYGDNGGGPPAEGHTPFGFACRPSDPDVDPTTNKPSKGCSLLYGLEGQRFHAIPLGDPRHLPPTLTKGGSVQYCAVAGAWARFDGASGAYDVKVPNGQGVTFQAAGGPAAVVGANGLTVGGSTAQPVALGAAVQALINAVNLLATGLASPGNVLSTSAACISALQAIQQVQTVAIKG